MKCTRSTKSAAVLTNALLSSLVILSLLSACDSLVLGTAVTATPIPTNTSTATPEPSATATATATSTATATPEPTATATATATPDKTGTAAAAATAAVDAFLVEIARDLKSYDLTLDSGHLAWHAEEAQVIKMNSYGEEKTLPLEGLGSVGDFLLQSEITWDSSSGLAGCGLIFRSTNDLDKGEQYQYYMMRLENAPGWIVAYYKDGREQYGITLDGHFKFTSILNDKRQATNKIAILARGDQFTVFLNGQGMRPLTNNKLSEGMIGVLGWQESGTSQCEFNNTWVWSFDEP
jgi:hypothetical protein